MEGDAEERQIQARFVTKLKTPYKVPATAITIPANLTRLGLSTIVNSLLNAGNPDWENQPFDFLIDGELVRMSLEQFLLAKGISAEKIIEIEYIKAVVPRKQEEPSLHDDWGEAMSTLVGHTQRVSSVVWPEHETIYSASWDHSIRRWDVETGQDSAKIFCGKALNYLHVGGEGSALIAAGASDPILRIWDPRKPGTPAPIYQFSSHTSWVSACKWHDKSWFHLLSASYDGKVMLWDLRTAWPLAVIESHEDKVLCADW